MSLDQHASGSATKARPRRTDQHWPLLMRVSEVAFELGLSTRRIYQLIHAGELPLIKVGKASRVPSASVLKLASTTAAPERLPPGMGGNTRARKQIHAAK